MATLTTYRQTVAPLIGPFYKGTATSGSLVSVLEATAAPFKTALSADAFFEGYNLFRPAAADATDKNRIVRVYAPSTGMLTPDRAWANSPYSVTGEAFELHGIVPPVTDGINDLHALINEGLLRVPIVVEFTFQVASATASRHSLAVAAPWLTRERWVRQVGVLPQGQTDRTLYNPFEPGVSGWTETDGSTIYLCGLSANTTDTVFVKAIKPAYYHCAASAGAYGSQSGLSLETDVCGADAKWVAQSTLLEVWERLGMEIASSDASRVEKEQAKAAVRFSRLTRLNFREPARTFRPRVRAGPSR